ncbi:MAG: hypothetical protein WCN95_12205 [bacterium]
MDISIHRINTVAGLRSIPVEFGTEIDIRADGSALILNHEPFIGGERFIDYLSEYQHGLLILNIKEAGIEDEVLRLVRERGIPRFFLLDVEFPYIFKASRRSERAIAMRYSEEESIETVIRYREKVDWVWIDTITRLPLDLETVDVLKGFKTCLVCPERWGRLRDISPYTKAMHTIGFRPAAVMTSMRGAKDWLQFDETLCGHTKQQGGVVNT